MDWKAFTFVIIGLVVFFTYRQCTEEETPNYDQVQAESRAAAQAQKQSETEQQNLEARKDSLKKARVARGGRPAAQIAALSTPEYRAELTTRGAALSRFELLKDQFKEAARDWASGLRLEDAPERVPVNLVTTNVDAYEVFAPLRFEIRQGIHGVLPDADFELLEHTNASARFKYEQPDLPIAIYKNFEVHPSGHPYEMWMTVRVVNTGSESVSFLPSVLQQGYQHASETEGGMFSTQPNLQQVICRVDGEVTRLPFSEAEDGGELPHSGIGQLSFVGVESNYFLSAMIPGDDRPASCYLHALPSRVMIAELRYGEVRLAAGEAATFTVKNYLGPKKFNLLRATGHGLEEAVDFGIFAPIARLLLWLMLFFQAKVVNWGVAIILLTVVVKLVLTPLTHKSFQSAERMKALKPEVDKINEKYKEEPQEKQKAIMALYKSHNVNPLGGCLPTLLQMPIWFALFQTLRSSPELYRAEFFGWITDLSTPDPYFITPVVMGAMMFLQQKMTPMTGDSAQQKMMVYMMPIMFSGFMLFLPSGLTLYILVNTVLSIAHQAVVHRRSIATRLEAMKSNAGKKSARKK